MYFELWHYWGRTAKFGVWMQGPDYTQWHGIYELLERSGRAARGDGRREAGGRRGGERSHDACWQTLSPALDRVRRRLLPLTRDQ